MGQTAQSIKRDQANQNTRATVAAQGFNCLQVNLPAPQNNNDKIKMVVNADADGLISAALLKKYARYEVAGYISSNHSDNKAKEFPKKGFYVPAIPDEQSLDELLQNQNVVAVDLMAPNWFSITNHVVHYDHPKDHPKKPCWTNGQAQNLFGKQRLVSPSHGAGVCASKRKECEISIRYRYILGTAQLVLAWLEHHGKVGTKQDPKFLTWEQLIRVANCDSGLQSAFGRYCANPVVWWDELEKSVSGRAPNTMAGASLSRSLTMRELLSVENSFNEMGRGLCSANVKSPEDLNREIDSVSKIFDIRLPHCSTKEDDLEVLWEPSFPELTKRKKRRVSKGKVVALNEWKNRPVPDPGSVECIAYSWVCSSNVAEFKALVRPKTDSNAGTNSTSAKTDDTDVSDPRVFWY